MIRRLDERALRERIEPLGPAPQPPAQPEATPSARLLERLRAMLQAELARYPSALGSLLARELPRFIGMGPITVCIHPSDRALLGETERLAEALSLDAPLAFVEDPTLTRGGCTISADESELDARVETRVERALSLALEEARRA